MKNKNIFLELPKDIQKKLKKESQPSFINPMLATLTKDYFSSDKWIYEPKYDGERCLAFKKDGKVNLMSRNKKEINKTYPEIQIALSKQLADNFIIDGEIVAIKNGVSNFELLQERINLRDMLSVSEKEKTIPVVYCIFDLIYLDGYDVRNLPLYMRKDLLEKLLNYNDALVYTTHKVGNGLLHFKEACKRHWEGLIAKKIDSTYVSVRSRDWLKFKCVKQQELVIGGYTNPSGSRKYFGALLVGYYEGGKFKYAGKVGTGFSYDTLKILGTKLLKLKTNKCPFSNYDETVRNVNWVRPKLVAEFKFAEWTEALRLRVPRYIGLRGDKDAKDVVREVAS